MFRRRIRSCNTVLSLPGSVTSSQPPKEEPSPTEKHFKMGGKINFDLNALKSRSDKPITNRLALLALTINVDANSQQVPKIFYSTSFKMTSYPEGSGSLEDDQPHWLINNATNGEPVNSTSAQEASDAEDSADKRHRRDAKAEPVVETFRETRVFRMDESRDNELWLDITREIPRWKRAFHHPESVMEITVTYFFPSGDVLSNEISVSTEDASLVIFSKDDQKLEELQQKSKEVDTEVHDVNKVERRKRSTDNHGLASSTLNEDTSSPTLFREQRLRKRRNMRNNKRNGGKRRRQNKRRRNNNNRGSATMRGMAGDNPHRATQVEKYPEMELTDADEAKKKEAGLCHLQEYIIDFEVLGWDTWIIYPKKYAAFTCGGECTRPVMQALHPTNHGMLQSLMQHKTGAPAGGKDHLCCVPSKLSALSMLYMENGMVVTRHHPDMIVDQCACR